MMSVFQQKWHLFVTRVYASMATPTRFFGASVAQCDFGLKLAEVFPLSRASEMPAKAVQQYVAW